MATFQEVVDEVKQGLVQIVTREGTGFLNEVLTDGEAFLRATKDDLELWARQLAAGQLSKNDFEFLVRGKRDLAAMAAATQAGLAAIRIDRIRAALIDLVVMAAGKLI